MLKCTRCGIRSHEDYMEIPNYGVFCAECARALAEEGRQLIAKDQLELGSIVVDARLKMLRNSSAITVH